MLPSDFSPPILRFGAVDSTNNKMKELVRKGLAEGSVLIAESQGKGRGRGTRSWHSPSGGLYCSYFLFPKEKKRPTDLAILAGVAVAQTMKDMLPKSTDMTVKWPNDVLVNGKKVAGVLCEALGPAAADACIVGIGINVNLPSSELRQFLGNPFPATSMMLETDGSDYVMDDVLKTLSRKLFTLYHLYHEQGFPPIQYLWDKNCRMIGKKVELREMGWQPGSSEPGAATDRGVVVGTFLGIDDTGALILANARGERYSYSTGEISCYWP